MLRVIHEIRPRYVLAENVRGAVNLALDTVCSGLVGEGYKVYPYVIPASAVGAPHQRERLFVFGVRRDVADRLCLGSEAGIPRQNARKEGESNLSDYSGEGGRKLWPTPTSTERSGINPNTGSGAGLSKTVRLWPTPREFMYKDSQLDRGKGNIGEKVGGQLNPDWVEQLMNFPEGWTDLDVDEPEPWPGWPALMGEDQHPYEPPRTVTGCPNRAKRLKCLGNAVVPQQALPLFEAIAIMEMVSSPVRKREEEDGKNGS